MGQRFSLRTALAQVRLNKEGFNRATISTIAVRKRTLFFGYYPTAEFLIGTVDDPVRDLGEFSPAGKFGYFAESPERDDDGNLRPRDEYVLILHRPGWSPIELDQAATLGTTLFKKVAGEMILRDINDQGCSAVTLLKRTRGTDEAWAHFDASRSISDFYVTQTGDIAVISNGFAAYVDDIALLSGIGKGVPVLKEGVPVKAGDRLTRYRLPGGGFRMSIYHREERVQRVYDMNWKVVVTEPAEEGPLLTTPVDYADGEDSLLVLNRGTPRVTIRRKSTHGDSKIINK